LKKNRQRVAMKITVTLYRINDKDHFQFSDKEK